MSRCLLHVTYAYITIEAFVYVDVLSVSQEKWVPVLDISSVRYHDVVAGVDAGYPYRDDNLNNDSQKIADEDCDLG